MGRKKKAGRPEELTPSIVRKLVQALSVGLYVETACDIVGISRGTFYEWIKKGEENPNSKYGDFLTQIREALAKAEAYSVQKIRKSDNWQAHAWWLERKFPQKWRKQSVVEIRETEGIGKTIKWDDEVTELIAKLTKKLEDQSEDGSEVEPERTSDSTLEREVETS